MRRLIVSFAALGSVLLVSCGDGSDSGSPNTSSGADGASATAGTDTTAAETTAAEDGSATTASGESSATAYPLTIDNCGYELTFDAPPERVLILNGTSVAEVQSFIALGIEDSILANSQSYGQSDIEGMVDKIAAIPTGGLTLNENFEVPREQVLALEPDLVVSTWSGGFSETTGSATRDELASVGIQSWVSPVNCAYGADDPRPEDQQRYDNQTYLESFEMLRELGLIFDVQDRAETFIAEAQARIDAVVAPAGDPASVLLAYPGMSMMNANGIPQVFVGPFTDSVLEAAGGVNSFDGFTSFNDGTTITAEALAAADVDVLAVGVFMPDENAELYAGDIFGTFPQWTAAQNDAWVSIAETFYLGPYNYVGIEKLAEAIAAVE
jgi:iron complex transport system substrate-binding protein